MVVFSFLHTGNHQHTHTHHIWEASHGGSFRCLPLVVGSRGEKIKYKGVKKRPKKIFQPQIRNGGRWFPSSQPTPPLLQLPCPCNQIVIVIVTLSTQRLEFLSNFAIFQTNTLTKAKNIHNLMHQHHQQHYYHCSPASLTPLSPFPLF